MNETFIRLPNNCAAYWGKKKNGDLLLVKHHLKHKKII